MILIKVVCRNKPMEYEVSSSITVVELKKLIESRQNINALDQKLYFKGKSLENTKRLNEYAIESHSTIHVVMNQKKISVILQESAKKVDLTVLNSFSIGQIKEMAFKEAELPDGSIHMSVCHDNTVLSDDSILADLKDMIDGNLQIKKSERKHKILISNNAIGFKRNLDVNSTETIKQLKYHVSQALEEYIKTAEGSQKIPDNASIELQHLILTTGHQVLQDDDTIEKLDIPQETTINVTLGGSPEIKINVKEANGATYTVKCSDQNSVSYVKEKVAENSKRLAKDIILFFNDKRLDDNNSLESFHIRENSTLIMATKVTLNFKGDAITESITVDDCDTFKKIKDQIHEKLKLQKDQIVHLIFEGKRLEDHEKICNYTFRGDSVIQVSVSFPIEFKSPDGKPFTVDLELDDFLWSVKEKIFGQYGFSKDSIAFYKNSEELKDDRKVRDYGIKRDTSLHIAYKAIEVIICEDIQEQTPIQIHAHCKISQLKEKIQEKLEYPIEDQTLIYNTHILEDSNAIVEYGIHDKAEIKLKLENKVKFTLRFEQHGRQEVEVHSFEKVRKLRIRVCRNLKMQESQVSLNYNGKPLDDNKTWKSYEMANDSFIHVVVIKSLMRVYIKSSDGQIMDVDLLPTDTISVLKSKIQERFKINPGKLGMLHAGTPLEDPDKKPSDYGVQNETVIFVFKRQNVLTLIVNCSDGRKFELYLLNTDTIATVKKSLFEKYGIDLKTQMLIKEDKVLEDAKSLADYGIVDQSEVFLVIKLESKIIIKNAMGKSVEFKIALKDKLVVLKSSIEHQFQCQLANQRLFSKGRELDLEKTFCSYEFVEGTEIYMIPKSSAPLIFWKNAEGKMYVVQVGSKDTFKVLKEKWSMSDGKPVYGIPVDELGPLSATFGPRAKNLENLPLVLKGVIYI